MDPKTALDWLADHSVWQIAAAFAGLYSGLCAVLLALGTLFERDQRRAYFNAAATAVSAAGVGLAWLVVAGAVDDHSGTKAVGALLVLTFLSGAMAGAPAGSRWWLFPFLPLLELLFFVDIVLLGCATAGLALAYGLPALAVHHQDMGDPFFADMARLAARPAQIAAAGGVALGAVIYVARRLLITWASAAPSANKGTEAGPVAGDTVSSLHRDRAGA